MATTQTISETKLEKLDPPTSLGPLRAYLAEVTRFYEQDFDTKVRTEYGGPIIKVIWGVTVEEQLIKLEAAKVEVAVSPCATPIYHRTHVRILCGGCNQSNMRGSCSTKREHQPCRCRCASTNERVNL